jgi:hypothetical protein
MRMRNELAELQMTIYRWLLEVHFTIFFLLTDLSDIIEYDGLKSRFESTGKV